MRSRDLSARSSAPSPGAGLACRSRQHRCRASRRRRGTRSVGALPTLAEDLADVLVRHLVLEHLDDHAPWLFEDEGARELDRARGREPAPEPRARAHELELRELQPALEVCEREVAVRFGDLAKERRLEPRREMRAIVHVISHRAHA